MDSSTDGGSRVYALSRGGRLLSRALGAWCIAVGSAITYFLAVHGEQNSGARNYLLDADVIFGLGLIYLGTIIFRGGSRLSVILSADSVQINGLWLSATLRMDEVLGRRQKAYRSGMRTILISKQRAAKIPDLAFDDFFNSWLASIPDLDAIDKEKRRSEGKLHWWED
jgi:hypothetical protein